MTQIRDDSRLKDVLAATGPVLLDFDGPVCKVYPGHLNMRAADALRRLVRGHGMELPAEFEQTRDPLAVLRHTSSLDNTPLVEEVEQALTSIELDAVAHAPPTDGASELLVACSESNRPVVIVSNNAAEAIERYVGLHSLGDFICGVVGRSHARPYEMKPHPHSIQRALHLVGATPKSCVLVGDSVTDIQVARRTGLHTVAYVKAPDRLQRLAAEEPDALVDHIGQLASALRNLRDQ